MTALAWNRDPRNIETRRRAHSAGAQSALGRQQAIERVFKPTLHHLADRIGARLRAKPLAGRTITVRVRFADLRSVTRALTLSAPISATRALANVAEDLCYDREALEARKEHKPKNSATNAAAAMGIEILTEAQYRELQTLGDFDTKTSSWVKTPPDIRERGGAIFCDRRYDHVFTHHNGAESYSAARAFRGALKV